jgi:hypothetical protein
MAVLQLAEDLRWEGYLKLENTFSDGKSGSTVMSVKLHHLNHSRPFILKVGPSWDIQDELQNY